MDENNSPFKHYLRLKKKQEQCAFCRFMRALSFSAIGALIGYYGSTSLGSNQPDAIIYAFACSLFLVVYTSDKKKKR